MSALSGVKVLDLSRVLAGPWCGQALADLGADVIKVESFDGDDTRGMGPPYLGEISAYFACANRNKRSLCLDLHRPESAEVIHALVKDADVLIENFRPGTLEQWGLDFDTLSALNPGLIMLRVSGYGQTGPLRDLPGFGVIAEAMGGLRHITGMPGEAPVRPGISIGDSLSALHGVIGVLMALYHRVAHGGKGQVVDVALYEAVFNMMEGAVPEYDRYGLVREPAGSAIQGIAPTNAYPCSDGYVLIAGNGDSIFKRLMHLIGRDDLGTDPELARNPGRVARVAEIDQAIGQWAQLHTMEQALAQLATAGVPAGRIFTVKDIVNDPHYQARDMLRTIELRDGSTLRVPGVVPKLSATPGGFSGGGPELGQDTDAVLRAYGLSDDAIADLRARGVVA